ncbi:MAG TPA: hypothetical protein VHL11_00675, partial [Phototrophicaceae bacterium]|nr:hypothetical protein [Phototrophicaceae bacterium]
MSHDNAQKQTATHDAQTGVKDELQPQTSSPSLATLMQRTNFTPPGRRPDVAGIMQLQRTVGNAATRRLVEPHLTASPIALQRQIMSYKEFRESTGQTATTTSLQEFKEKGRFGRSRKVNKIVATEHTNQAQEEIFTGVVGANALQKERHQNNPKYNLGGTDTLKVNINAAFEAYEADPESLQKLIELYNTITYWQAANLGRSWVAASAGIVETLMKQIQAEVQAKTEKLGGEKSGTTADSLAKPGSLPRAKMPDFLQEVGLPQAYFDEHIAG